MESRTNLSAALHIPFLIPLLAVLSAFPPLSTDMYLPAMPYLGKLWGVELKIISLTLIGFFLGYSPALLVYGPLSDRFGRKAPLLAGLSLFILASLLCSIAGSAQTLTYARILQGIGAAAPSVLGLSITKDHYTGPERYKILALISIIVGLAPMLGPTLGSWALLFGSWHIIFILQAAIAVIAFAGVLRIPETNPAPRHIPLMKMAVPYLALFGNLRFLSLSFLFSASMSPLFAFIGASADIYITGFSLSEQVFGLFFGMNAFSIMTGSFICMNLSAKFSDITLIRLGFGGILTGGLLIMTIPHSQVLFFTFPMCFISFCFGFTRPVCINLILETVNRDIGSASSLMMFSNFIFGAAAMWIISLGGEWKITMIGFMAVLSGLATFFVFWFLLKGVKK
ncbi:multidrug effflux MFS transporter [Desulfobacula toluolica]|nr:multidrug effflux MFS transporter [Desulfobacula toluolica]